MEFDSRESVLIWIVLHQIAQRNLNPMQLSYYRGLHYNSDKRLTGFYDRSSAQDQSGQRNHSGRSTARPLAEHHNVSPRTIRRDAQLANAINTIAETSPETKVDILSGKTRISRKQLKELTGGAEEDVALLVTQIVEGTFDNKKAGSLNSGKTGNNSDIEDMRHWEVEFSKMTDEFRQVLRTHAKTDDTASVRNALRAYISMLEDLYKQI